jgi:hypothetical protein
MITEDCKVEDDSWANAVSCGPATATHKPPNNIPANMPVHKFAFTIILLEFADTSAKLNSFRAAIHGVKRLHAILENAASTQLAPLLNPAHLFYPPRTNPTHVTP